MRIRMQKRRATVWQLQLRYTTLHCTTLHYTTLHYTVLFYRTQHYVTLHLHFGQCYKTGAACLGSLKERLKAAKLEFSMIKKRNFVMLW